MQIFPLPYVHAPKPLKNYKPLSFLSKFLYIIHVRGTTYNTKNEKLNAQSTWNKYLTSKLDNDVHLHKAYK